MSGPSGDEPDPGEDPTPPGQPAPPPSEPSPEPDPPWEPRVDPVVPGPRASARRDFWLSAEPPDALRSLASFLRESDPQFVQIMEHKLDLEEFQHNDPRILHVAVSGMSNFVGSLLSWIERQRPGVIIRIADSELNVLALDNTDLARVEQLLEHLKRNTS